MSGRGRGYSRGRGSSRGRGVWQQGQESSSKPNRATTRPYKRSQSSSGRGSTQSRKRPSLESAAVVPEKASPSQQVLARAAAIRESASQFARDDSDDSSDGEGENEGRELVKNILKMYYQHLPSEGILLHVCPISVMIVCTCMSLNEVNFETTSARSLCRWRRERGRRRQ